MYYIGTVPIQQRCGLSCYAHGVVNNNNNKKRKINK